jgi:hypothetical protein
MGARREVLSAGGSRRDTSLTRCADDGLASQARDPGAMPADSPTMGEIVVKNHSSRERTRTGRKKPGRQLTQRVPSSRGDRHPRVVPRFTSTSERCRCPDRYPTELENVSLAKAKQRKYSEDAPPRLALAAPRDHILRVQKRARNRAAGAIGRATLLPANSAPPLDCPVTLPPGRARLATRPVATGSPAPGRAASAKEVVGSWATTEAAAPR